MEKGDGMQGTEHPEAQVERPECSEPEHEEPEEIKNLALRTQKRQYFTGIQRHS